jgi:predicted O-linked N-acetylglucosamine transferase (SPINDLY family)
MFARKPAPVQIAWLAYPGTTGIKAMDFRLTDPWLDPHDSDSSCYTERSLRLADTFWCYEPHIVDLEPNKLPALSNGFITFACLNNFCKVSDASLRTWAKVMARVKDSRLLLLSPQGQHRQHVLAQLAQGGISHDRVEFIAYLPRRDYLSTYHSVDLCLDTLPYNGHTTSLDSYWMGVPVVTQVGNTVAGRAGWSQLNNLGLPELAAIDDDSFVDIAFHLATDIPRLSELRQRLRHMMENSPLMDKQRFARSMENVFKQAWHHYQAS